MSKTIACYVLVLLTVNLSIAQKRAKIGFQAGAYGGGILSQIFGDNYAGFDRLGPQAGLFSKYVMNNDFQIKTELCYIQKGSKQVLPKQGIYTNFKLDYIEVPVLLNYFYKDDIYAEAGLGFSYLLSAKVDLDGSGFIDQDLGFKNYELSGIIGAGYIFHPHFSISARWAYSILPIRPHPGNQTYLFDRGCYNNYIAAYIHYYFTKQK